MGLCHANCVRLLRPCWLRDLQSGEGVVCRSVGRLVRIGRRVWWAACVVFLIGSGAGEVCGEFQSEGGVGSELESARENRSREGSATARFGCTPRCSRGCRSNRADR